MRHLANIVPGIVSDTGKRAIARHLARASSAGDGSTTVAAFTDADRIRQSMNLSWHDLLGVDIEPEQRDRATP